MKKCNGKLATTSLMICRLGRRKESANGNGEKPIGVTFGADSLLVLVHSLDAVLAKVIFAHLAIVKLVIAFFANAR